MSKKNKKTILTAFATAAAVVSTPAMATEGYTLRNTYGAEINVLEMTQSEAREIMREKIHTQVPNDDLTLQESYRLKVLFNWHFNAGARDAAIAEGFDEHRAQSLANAMTYLYGRYIVENDMDMAFQPFEFNPNVSKPVNGYTPAAQPGHVKAANGEEFAICAIATPDDNFTPAQWYQGFTGTQVSEGVLPAVYSRYMREETLWHERAHCFFIGDEAQADYYGVLQLLNEYRDSDELDSLIEYLRFKSNMWMFSSSTGYTIGSEHVGPATLAALEDFQSQERQLTEEEIWTMASDFTTMDGSSIEDAAPRWEAIRLGLEQQAINSQRRLQQINPVGQPGTEARQQNLVPSSSYKTTVTYTGM